MRQCFWYRQVGFSDYLMLQQFSILVSLIFAMIFFVNRNLDAQVIDEIRNEVRPSVVLEPETDSSDFYDSDRNRPRNSIGYFDDDSNGPFEDFFGSLFLAVAATPYWLPRSCINDDSFCPGYFGCPYPDHRHGLMSIDYLDEGDSFWLYRTSFEYGSNLDQVSRFGGKILIDSAFRFGIDGQFNFSHESLGGNLNDELWTGDLNLVVRFAQSENLQMRSGIGINWVSDSADDDIGFNFTYGGDWFPGDPWIVSGEIDWGRIGEASLFHGRATIGLNYRRSEIYTGYDYLDIGKAQVQGIIAGIRFWF